MCGFCLFGVFACFSHGRLGKAARLLLRKLGRTEMEENRTAAQGNLAMPEFSLVLCVLITLEGLHVLFFSAWDQELVMR